ncbi:hypothetical protein CW304_27715 [Bacillus sp. UFRGS-B20]|nr:hypothetical protein CW304_27715 [Bacillus sp. UFRGS-B20]
MIFLHLLLFLDSSFLLNKFHTVYITMLLMSMNQVQLFSIYTIAALSCFSYLVFLASCCLLYFFGSLVPQRNIPPLLYILHTHPDTKFICFIPSIPIYR